MRLPGTRLASPEGKFKNMVFRTEIGRNAYNGHYAVYCVICLDTDKNTASACIPEVS